VQPNLVPEFVFRSGLEWKLSNYYSCLLAATAANHFEEKTLRVPTVLTVAVVSVAVMALSLSWFVMRERNLSRKKIITF